MIIFISRRKINMANMNNFGTGYLRVQVTTGDDVLPLAGAEVSIIQRDGVRIYRTLTGESGQTEDFALPTSCFQNSLDPDLTACALSVCDIDVRAKGFVTQYIRGIEILDTQTTILPVRMEPLAAERYPERNTVVEVSPNSMTCPSECPIRAASPARTRDEVIIPDFIIVHLGKPQNSEARSVRVAFPEYIKNVASSEIYATWPEQSLRANIHAIVSFALNRIYTEWYPNRGYNFDITNSTAYDQYYRQGGPIYESINAIVDEIFNVYAHRQGFRNPYLDVHC
jgi:hypothetical protein